MKIIHTNTCHNLWLLPVIEVSSELTLTYTPSSGRESISFSLFIISNWKPTWSIGIVYFRAKFWRAPTNRQIYQLNQESMVKQIIFTHVIRFRYANFSEEKNAFIGKKSSILTGFFFDTAPKWPPLHCFVHQYGCRDVTFKAGLIKITNLLRKTEWSKIPRSRTRLVFHGQSSLEKTSV